MKKSNPILQCLTVAGFAGLASQANAAGITQGSVDWLHYQNNSTISGWTAANGSSTVHDISVVDGSAGYAGFDAAGNATSGTFGDGTVEAYHFFTVADGGDGFNNGNESIITLTQSGGLITGGTTDTTIQNASATELWESTDPAGFTSTADYSTNTNAIGLSDFSGTIDISGLSSGSIYFLFGHYRGGSTATSGVTLTMLDGVTDVLGGSVVVTANDTANNWEQYVVEATFVNDIGADSIDYSFGFNGNGRMGGIVIDGVAIVPEPASMTLAGLGVLGLLFRRRR